MGRTKDYLERHDFLDDYGWPAGIKGHLLVVGLGALCAFIAFALLILAWQLFVAIAVVAIAVLVLWLVGTLIVLLVK